MKGLKCCKVVRACPLCGAPMRNGACLDAELHKQPKKQQYIGKARQWIFKQPDFKREREN